MKRQRLAAVTDQPLPRRCAYCWAPLEGEPDPSLRRGKAQFCSLRCARRDPDVALVEPEQIVQTESLF